MDSHAQPLRGRSSCSCGPHQGRQGCLPIQLSVGPTAPCLCPSSQGAQRYPSTTASSAPFLLPSREDCDPTFRCAVYIGHAAIFQLHRLSILKGKRFCNESNACLSPELGVGEQGPSGRGCLASLMWQGRPGCPHLSALPLGECTQWSHLRAGSLALQEACLLWRQKWREMGLRQAQKRAEEHLPALVEACWRESLRV